MSVRLPASYSQVNVLLSDCGIVMRIINLVFLWSRMHFVYETVIHLKSSQTVAWNLFLFWKVLEKCGVAIFVCIETEGARVTTKVEKEFILQERC